MVRQFLSPIAVTLAVSRQGDRVAQQGPDETRIILKARMTPTPIGIAAGCGLVV